MGQFLVGCLCGGFVAFTAIALCLVAKDGDMHDD